MTSSYLILVHLDKELYPYARKHYIHKDSTIKLPSVRSIEVDAKVFETEELAKDFLDSIKGFFDTTPQFCPEVLPFEVKEKQLTPANSRRIQY